MLIKTNKQTNTGVAILRKKNRPKLKMVKRDKGGHYIMRKEGIFQEDITIVFMHTTSEHLNIYSKTNRAKRRNKQQ